jgi:hypothetical protein
VKEASSSHWSDFAIAKEARQTQRTEPFLNHLSVVIRHAEHSVSASVATAQAPAENGLPDQFRLDPSEQCLHIFGCCLRVTALELNRLTNAGQFTNRQYSRFGITADQVANEKVSSVKPSSIVNHDSDEEIAASLRCSSLERPLKVQQGPGRPGGSQSGKVVTIRFRDGRVSPMGCILEITLGS